MFDNDSANTQKAFLFLHVVKQQQIGFSILTQKKKLYSIQENACCLLASFVLML